MLDDLEDSLLQVRSRLSLALRQEAGTPITTLALRSHLLLYLRSRIILTAIIFSLHPMILLPLPRTTILHEQSPFCTIITITQTLRGVSGTIPTEVHHPLTMEVYLPYSTLLPTALVQLILRILDQLQQLILPFIRAVATTLPSLRYLFTPQNIHILRRRCLLMATLVHILDIQSPTMSMDLPLDPTQATDFLLPVQGQVARRVHRTIHTPILQ
jgi:hypothetical protein